MIPIICSCHLEKEFVTCPWHSPSWTHTFIAPSWVLETSTFASPKTIATSSVLWWAKKNTLCHFNILWKQPLFYFIDILKLKEIEFGVMYLKKGSHYKWVVYFIQVSVVLLRLSSSSPNELSLLFWWNLNYLWVLALLWSPWQAESIASFLVSLVLCYLPTLGTFVSASPALPYCIQRSIN